MIKIILLLLFSACSTLKTSDPLPSPTVSSSPSIKPSPSPSPISAPVNLIKLIGVDATKEQSNYLKLAEKRMPEILRSECFKTEWMKLKPSENQGKSNEQILKEITTIPTKNPVVPYWGSNFFGRCTKVVGYINIGSPEIYINWCIQNSWQQCDKEANLAHERTHQLGYTHNSNNPSISANSVPYQIGNTYLKCCKN